MQKFEEISIKYRDFMHLVAIISLFLIVAILSADAFAFADVTKIEINEIIG